MSRRQERFDEHIRRINLTLDGLRRGKFRDEARNVINSSSIHEYLANVAPRTTFEGYLQTYGPMIDTRSLFENVLKGVNGPRSLDIIMSYPEILNIRHYNILMSRGYNILPWIDSLDHELLWKAAYNKDRQDIVKELYARGYIPDQETLHDAIIYAIRHGRIGLVNGLIELGTIIDDEMMDLAIDNIDMVQLLIVNGGDIEFVYDAIDNQYDYTPEHQEQLIERFGRRPSEDVDIDQHFHDMNLDNDQFPGIGQLPRIGQ